MSRLPPISRGGSVPSPSAAAAGTAGGESSDRSCPTRLANSSSRRRIAVDQLARRGDADRARKGVGRNRDSGQLGRPGMPTVELPADEVGTGEDVGEKAETGENGAEPEVTRLDFE